MFETELETGGMGSWLLFLPQSTSELRPCLRTFMKKDQWSSAELTYWIWKGNIIRKFSQQRKEFEMISANSFIAKGKKRPFLASFTFLIKSAPRRKPGKKLPLSHCTKNEIIH